MMLGPYHPGLAHPKVPHAVDRDEKRRESARIDREERVKVRARSGGRCEVYEPHHSVGQRCPARAVEIHHLIGGFGRRNVGESVAAQKPGASLPPASPRCGPDPFRWTG